MSLSYTVRPISDRTWLGQTRRDPTRFQSKWSDTLDLLDGRTLDGRTWDEYPQEVSRG